MTKYLCTSSEFIQMLPSESFLLKFEAITDDRAKHLLSLGSLNTIKDPHTCEILSSRLDLDIQPGQENSELKGDISLILARVVQPIGEVQPHHQYTIHFWFVWDVIIQPYN